jgi:hypothetical protein
MSPEREPISGEPFSRIRRKAPVSAHGNGGQAPVFRSMRAVVLIILPGTRSQQVRPAFRAREGMFMLGRPEILVRKPRRT